MEEHRLRVSENRMLRRIFGPKREEDEFWRKLQDDELCTLYFSMNVVMVIKSRRMRWAGHVAHMGKGGCVYRVLGVPKGRDHWEDLGICGSIKLCWTLGSRDEWGELDLAGSG
jgi:hypothetical protein